MIRDPSRETASAVRLDSKIWKATSKNWSRSRAASRRSSRPAPSPPRVECDEVVELRACIFWPNAPVSGNVCISDGEPPREALGPPDAAQAARANSRRCRRRSSRGSARRARARGSRTSAAARFSPFAPVGGTMCAASPARNSRPKRIGSATKLRSGAMLFSIDGPVTSAARPRRVEARGAARPRTRRRSSARPCRSSGHLHVVAAARRRAHAAQREAALVVRLDRARARPAASPTARRASRTDRRARRS